LYTRGDYAGGLGARGRIVCIVLGIGRSRVRKFLSGIFDGGYTSLDGTGNIVELSCHKGKENHRSGLGLDGRGEEGDLSAI
jgi:hypothetical protein